MCNTSSKPPSEQSEAGEVLHIYVVNGRFDKRRGRGGLFVPLVALVVVMKGRGWKNE